MIFTALVWPVLARMVNDAGRHFKQCGQMYVARQRLANSSAFFEGLPPPPDADFSLSYSSGSLSDWKQRLFYGERGDDWYVSIENTSGSKYKLNLIWYREKQFVQETGWTLLHSLCFVNSLQALQEYVYVKSSALN